MQTGDGRSMLLGSCQEHRLGSIEFEKIADMTVCDCDFLHGAIEKAALANLVATTVDGEVACKAYH